MRPTDPERHAGKPTLRAIEPLPNVTIVDCPQCGFDLENRCMARCPRCDYYEPCGSEPATISSGAPGIWGVGADPSASLP